MKSASIAAAVLASVAVAQPHGHQRRHHHDKREVVVEWTTLVQTITVVVDEYSTETLYPSVTAQAAATPSSQGAPGEFYQAASSSSSVAAPSPPPVVAQPSYEKPAEQAHTTTSTTPVAVPVPTVVQPPPVVEPAPVKPSPSTVVAAPPVASPSTPSSGGSGSGGKSKSGKMTYYQVGPGACGYDDSGADSSKNIVALGAGFWNSVSTLTSYGVNQPANPLCDQEITITASNGKSCTGVIRDKCPGCPTDQSIDVSEKIFMELIGSTTAGVVDITWSFNNGKW